MDLNDWLDYQQNLHNKDIDLGLTRITKVYKNLFPNKLDFKIITIAGTNGKGSTGNFLANIFSAANVNYGWFSSPHIEKYNERFVINKNLATDVEIISAFEKIEKVRKNISLSYFEFSTLAALLIFQTKNIQVAILEIGLGGRLDSVNVVPNDISIITSISFDHTDFLGDTLDKIAFEKAGIIKANTQLWTPPNLPNIISKIANEKNTQQNIVEKYQQPLKMLGDWQKYNASLAKNSAQYLFDINDKIIDNALQKTIFSARAEVIKFQGKNIIFDTAHNEEAVKNLATLVPNDSIAIFAALKDKEIFLMIKAITSKIAIWYLLELDDKRALKINELKQYFNNEKILTCHYNTIFKKILSLNNKNIVIFGSFLTIAIMKKHLEIVIGSSE